MGIDTYMCVHTYTHSRYLHYRNIHRISTDRIVYNIYVHIRLL